MTINTASYISLSPSEQQTVREFAHQLSSGQLMAIVKSLPLQNTNLLPAIESFYAHQLLKIDPQFFPWMQKAEQCALENNLSLALYYLCRQFQVSLQEKRYQMLASQFEAIQHGIFLLDNLTRASQNYPIQPLPSPTAVPHFPVDIIESTLNLMRGFNYWRLYWAWCDIMMCTAVSLMDLAYRNRNQVQYVITAYQNICGWISWTLYAARLLLNFLVIFKHTLPCGYWMSDEEIQMVYQEGIWNRFKNQLNERKFEIMNDIIWGLVNFLCHWWLYGSPTMDLIGNVLTIGLLVGDNLLEAWNRSEIKTLHRTEMKQLQDEIVSLGQNIQSTVDSNQLQYLQEHLAHLECMQYHCQLNWKFIERGLHADRFFTGLQCFAFTWSCIFLVTEPTAMTSISMTLALSGPLCLFLVSWLSSVYKGYMNICSAQDARLRALLLCKTVSGREQTELSHLIVQQQFSIAQYQEKLVHFYWAKLVRTTILEGIIPLTIYFAFTYLTFPTAACIMGGLLIAAGCSHLWIEYCKPELTPLLSPQRITQHEEIDHAIQASQPYQPLKWLFHSHEELEVTSQSHLMASAPCR